MPWDTKPSRFHYFYLLLFFERPYQMKFEQVIHLPLEVLQQLDAAADVCERKVGIVTLTRLVSGCPVLSSSDEHHFLSRPMADRS